MLASASRRTDSRSASYSSLSSNPLMSLVPPAPSAKWPSASGLRSVSRPSALHRRLATQLRELRFGDRTSPLVDRAVDLARRPPQQRLRHGLDELAPLVIRVARVLHEQRAR